MSNTNGKQEFEKSRLEYCVRLYDREDSRGESLEKKAQFYLSFITVFIGAIFFKLDYLQWLAQVLSPEGMPRMMKIVVYVVIALLLLSVLSAVVSILESIRLRSYRSAFPNNPTMSLFSPDSRFIKGEATSDLLKECAFTYSTAMELNNEINDKKAKWLAATASFTTASILLFFVLLGLISFYILKKG